jgi:hypothetical protein
MNTIINFAAGYLAYGLLSGLYFRELTRGMEWVDDGVLGSVHGHALALGMIFLLLVLSLEKHFGLTKIRWWKIFFSTYNIGLILMLIMLTIRGTLDILATPLSKALDSSIAGTAGIAHIFLTIGLIYFFVILKRAVRLSSTK